ncbi:MAG: hypothetical protein K2H74_09100 [Paramuribaculum sp.]|nr:hypothetical protein [Paramuribaculum sp.]
MSKLPKILLSVIALTATALSAGAQEHFQRNLEQVSFVPKGQWIAGVSVGYSQSDQDNYQFFVFEKIKGDTYNFKVTPMALYSFKDNLAAGIKVGYERSKLQLDDGSLILDSETTFNADNLFSIRNNFFATGAFRNYISLGDSHRFGFFNEFQLTLGGGQSKYSNYTGGQGDNRHVEGTYEKNFNLNIGLTPGFVMFLNNYSAIEVNIGVLGFGYNYTRAVTNQVQVAHRKSKHANFKINLFSVQFGMAFYL